MEIVLETCDSLRDFMILKDNTKVRDIFAQLSLSLPQTKRVEYIHKSISSDIIRRPLLDVFNMKLMINDLKVQNKHSIIVNASNNKESNIDIAPNNNNFVKSKQTNNNDLLNENHNKIKTEDNDDKIKTNDNDDSYIENPSNSQNNDTEIIFCENDYIILKKFFILMLIIIVLLWIYTYILFDGNTNIEIYKR
jgi:hypothetical protein